MPAVNAIHFRMKQVLIMIVSLWSDFAPVSMLYHPAMHVLIMSGCFFKLIVLNVIFIKGFLRSEIGMIRAKY